MDWTIEEGDGKSRGTHYSTSSPQEVSPVSFILPLSSFTPQQLSHRPQQAYASDTRQ
jgi:hypothetical protein